MDKPAKPIHGPAKSIHGPSISDLPRRRSCLLDLHHRCVLLLQEDTRSPNPTAARRSAPRRYWRTRSLDPRSSLLDLGLPSHDPARPQRIQRSCCHREKKRAEVLLLLDPELLLPCRNPALGCATARQHKDMPPLTSLRTHCAYRLEDDTLRERERGCRACVGATVMRMWESSLGECGQCRQACAEPPRQREREKRERRQMREQRGTGEIVWMGSSETLTQLYIWNSNNGLSELLWASILLEAVAIYCLPPKYIYGSDCYKATASKSRLSLEAVILRRPPRQIDFTRWL